jgi:hypothetical protein
MNGRWWSVRGGRRTRLVGLAGLVLAVPAVGGCYLVPSQPDASSWRIHAQRDANDMAAALSTARLVLRTRDQGKLITEWAQVTITDAESMAGKASSKFSAEQAPPVEQDRATKISDAMDQAGSLISDAREEVVDGKSGTCSRFCTKLAKMSKTFQDFSEQLKHPPAAAAAAPEVSR